MRVRRHHRRNQRAQVLVVTAISAILLFSVMALAVDLGLLTNDQKSMQNVSDTAALSGAGDLPISTQSQAAKDALYAVQQNMLNQHSSNAFGSGDWSSVPSSWSSPSNQCTTSGHFCTLVTNNGVTVYVATPPQSIASAGLTASASSTCFASSPKTGPNNSSYSGKFYIEVDVCQTFTNNFASLLGQPRSVVASHSIAYHFGPAGPSGWALYSNTVVQSGNQSEQVQGDIYYGTLYQAGNGNGSLNDASLCALLLNGASSQGYSTQNGSTVSSGHIVVGYDATAPGGAPKGTPTVLWGHPYPDPRPLAANSTETYECATGGTNASGATIAGDPSLGNATIAGQACPNMVGNGNCNINQGTGTFCPNGSTWDTTLVASGLCLENPNLSAPNLPEPDACPNSSSTCTTTPSQQYSFMQNHCAGTKTCTPINTFCGTIDPTGKNGATTSLAPGVYVVDGSQCGGVTIQGGNAAASATQLTCISWVMMNSAQITVQGGYANLTSYGSPGCGGSNDSTNRSIIWSDVNDLGHGPCYGNNSPYVGGCFFVTGSASGCCPVTTVAGAIFLPNGEVNVGQNTAMQIDGQAIVQTWQDQSGNHPNVAITYDQSQLPGIIEVDRLVE